MSNFEKAKKLLSNHLPLPTAIVGLGKSGLSTYHLLTALGISKDQIFYFDDKAQGAEIPSYEACQKLNIKSLIVSPGYPLNKPWIKTALQNNIQVTSEINLASFFLENEHTIGITGSVGKSTTAALIYQTLKALDPNAFLGGNFGTPLADYALNIINQAPRAKYLVIELSSYQLENSSLLPLTSAVITALSPNHLERYPDLESYYAAKWNMLSQLNGPLILNTQGQDLKRYAESKNISSHISVLWANQKEHFDFDFSKCLLKGKHNYDNLALALTLIKNLNLPLKSLSEAILQLSTFSGLPHRMENLGTSDPAHVTFINDSKATTMESVLSAVHGLDIPPDAKLHLLLGGKDKNLPWHKLNELSNIKNIYFYFFGEVAPTACLQSQLSGPIYKTLNLALKELPLLLRSNDIVLLSPGGTSLDEFKSFEDRGLFFKNWVEQLKSPKTII